MAIIKLSDLSLADIKAALEFADQQRDFWANHEIDPDPEKEKEMNENFTCWEGRGEIIEEEIFNRFNQIFEPWTANLKN